MAKPTENRTSKLIQPLLTIACGVLLLALIIVSAFAYQWHGENVDLKKTNSTLRALNDASTITSLTTEISNQQSTILESQSKIAEYEKLIKEYEAILTENDLMPAAE